MVDTTKAAHNCIKDNDFESALWRFEHTTGRWTDYWWETLEKIYNNVKSLAKHYILDPATKTVKRIKQVADMVMSFVEDAFDEGSEKVYLFKFFDETGKLMFSKVGTTTRGINQRIREEIKYYRKHDLNVGNAIVESVYDCGELPAEGAESFCRAIFIKRHPNTYHKNDRFFGLNIPVEEFNQAVEKYLA